MTPRGMMQISPGSISMTLRDDQEFAIGIADVLARHRSGDEQQMAGHAGMGFGIARGGDGAQPGYERHLVRRHRHRPPAHRPDRHIAILTHRRGAEVALVDALEAAEVPDGRPDAIEPGAFVRRLRRGEGRAGQLLGIEAVIALLRRVAPDRQRPGQRLGLKTVAEARHVCRRHRARLPLIRLIRTN